MELKIRLVFRQLQAQKRFKDNRIKHLNLLKAIKISKEYLIHKFRGILKAKTRR